jgi:hypothetical protein
MRVAAFSLIVLLSIVDVTSSQTVDTTAAATTLPIFRPVLLGAGRDSIINTIDTQGLIQKGQKDAEVMFYCVVSKNGKVISSATYRGTPGSKLLQEEVLNRLDTAKLIPAVHDHKPVDAFYYGTVFFAIVNGKPRLRIFSNQESEELKLENDFIGPQPYFGGDSKFLGLHYPEQTTPVPVSGIAEIALKVDANGVLQQISLLSEYPPLAGFGAVAIADFKEAKFIPAFRNGQPVESSVTLPVYYKPRNWIFQE